MFVLSSSSKGLACTDIYDTKLTSKTDAYFLRKRKESKRKTHHEYDLNAEPVEDDKHTDNASVFQNEEDDDVLGVYPLA